MNVVPGYMIGYMILDKSMSKMLDIGCTKTNLDYNLMVV